jgi:drug/metabolite transporter (DMT)-like permease
VHLKKAGVRSILFIAVTFTSFSSILIRLTVSHPIAVSFYRMFFAFLLTLPVYAGVRLSGRTPGKAAFPGGRNIPRALAAGLFLAAHFATWITSLRYTTVASSVVLVSTHPVIVIILGALFLKEKVSRQGWFYTALVLGGTILLSAGDYGRGETVLFGNFLALMGGFFVALYFLIGRRVRAEVDMIPYTLLVYGISSLILLPLTLAARAPLTGYPPRELLLFAALALFCTLGGHSLYNYVLKYLSAAFVSVSILFEPVAATLLALLLFREIPSPLSLTGAVLIVFGIWRYVRLEAEAGKP